MEGKAPHKSLHTRDSPRGSPITTLTAYHFSSFFPFCILRCTSVSRLGWDRLSGNLNIERGVDFL
jgi:hypothetical protein